MQTVQKPTELILVIINKSVINLLDRNDFACCGGNMEFLHPTLAPHAVLYNQGNVSGRIIYYSAVNVRSDSNTGHHRSIVQLFYYYFISQALSERVHMFILHYRDFIVYIRT